MLNNPKRSRHKSHTKRRRWRADARKTIRLSNLSYLIFKIALASIILYSVIVTFRMKYLSDRCGIMEASIDSFYQEDGVSDIISNKSYIQR